ncbi:hypothetical protein EC957_001851 [Mortierella hygrophila]|uniref:Uncharacterized protein n=1 Tax=Mortierella hygrophila TaxID=979708 RepID=A0A9P6F4A5_9FUNG|nr:hypothetical protein EC957_001851 [Mortierella hygrophila]
MDVTDIPVLGESKLKHKIDVDVTNKSSERQGIRPIATPKDALPEVNKRPRHNHGRKSSLARPHATSIDPTALHVYKYVLDSVNIGRLFKEYQVASIATADNLEIRVTLENIPRFLSLNFIWDKSAAAWFVH